MTRVVESEGVPEGCDRIVTFGHQVFHSGYFSVSRRTAKTRDAGAEIVVEAERVRTAWERGVVGVRKPAWGGHWEVDIAVVVVVVVEGGLVVQIFDGKGQSE
jgi:hypothetical protein